LFLFLILVAVLFWRRGSRLPAFALCWMVLTFLPTSGLLPLEILRADRYTLTSVPVFAVIVAASFRAIERNLPGRMGKALLFLCWLVPFFLTVLFVQRIDVWRSSETLWRDVLAREPEHRIAMHNLGVWYAEKGDTTKAVVYLQRALSLDPSSVKTMNSLGLLYEASGRPSEAEALFKEAAEQSFKKNESLLNLASLYLREGRTGQAEACLIEASAIVPQDARIHYQLSVCYQKESRLEKALDEMRKAYLIEPSNPVYQVGLGRLLVAKGDLNQGLDLFETALKRNETFLPAYLGLGELFSNSGKLADARAAYETALHREPQNLDALRGLASVIGRMGDLDSAAVILEHLIARNPEDCEALANMAAVYLSRGRLPEAVSKARLAIECDSTRVTNYLNIYTAYVYLDSLRAAEKIIAKALRIAPNSPQVIYARVSLSLKAGNQPDTTVYYLEKLLGMNIDSALRARIQTLTDSLKKSM
jgi:tetratricopeptide (TPR) repeat protein